MAPLNWDLVMNIPLDALADEKGDDLYFQLIEIMADKDIIWHLFHYSMNEKLINFYRVEQPLLFDPEYEKHLPKLRRLFLVTRSLMQIKSMQAEVAMEEMVQMADKLSAIETRKEHELQEEIEELKNQLQFHQGTIGNDIEQLQSEILGLEKENENLHIKIKEKDGDIFGLQERIEKERDQIKELERENSELREDMMRFKEEMTEVQKVQELQEVTENKSTKLEEELSQRLHEKNKQIHKLFDEIKVYGNENEILQQQVAEIKKKFEEAVHQMEVTTNDYIKIKEALKQSEVAVDTIKREREYYKNEVKNLTKQGTLKDDTDDEILKTVSKRVEEWKEILLQKEEEIAHYQDLVKKLQSHMVSVRLDGEHTTVAILSKALEEKDKQIQSLRKQLSRATKDIEESTNIIENLKAGRTNVGQVNNIVELQNALHETTAALEMTQETLAEVEKETRNKDKELSDALNRMRQYEMGQYGLADAVTEIKECKNMIRIRDKQIEELLQQVNWTEIEIGELYDENELLRSKLGMDIHRPVKSSPSNYRSQKQKECALILSLQQKIGDLEEERVNLRQQLHEQAKEIKKLQQQYRSYSPQSQKGNIQQSSPQHVESESHNLSTPQHGENKILITDLQNDNIELKEAIENLTIENKQLQSGLKEMLESLKEKDEKSQFSVDDELLERLIKTAVEKATLSVSHTTYKNEGQQKRNKSDKVKSKSTSVNYPTASSYLKDDTVLLNSYILEILKEFNSLEKRTIEAENKLEKANNQFMLDQHQIGLLYQQYLEEKSQHEEKETKWQQEKKEVEEKREADSIRLEEFQHLLDTLAQDEPEVRRRLSETVRQMTTLRVSEAILSRKYTILQNTEAELQKENSKLKQDCVSVENKITQHTGHLQRFKEMAIYKIKALMSALEESVPLNEVEVINKQYMILSAKYSRLMEKEISMSNVEREQLQINNWENENKTLLKMLESEKSKVLQLQNIIEKKFGNNPSEDNSPNQEISKFVEQIAAREVKETHERQRADHFQQLYEQQKEVINSLEERNHELEEKVSNLTEQSINKQGAVFSKIKEGTLINDEDKVRMKELEESNIKLQMEVMKLKEIGEVACHQLKSIQKYNTSKEQELKELQKHFIELHSSSDDKMSTGQLYRQILQLQLAEASNVHKLEASKNKIIKLEAECLRLMNRCENREEIIYNLQKKFLNKSQFLIKVIKELHREYSGSIPLSKLEKLYKLITSLREEKVQLSKVLQKANEKSEASELKQKESESQYVEMEEMLNVFKTNKANEKIFEWHDQMEALRLSEIRLKRDVEKKIQEITHQKHLIEFLEKQVTDLEEENVKLEKKLQDKWLQWEETETELEIQQQDLQKTFGNTVNLIQVDQVLPGKPDHSQSESVQLEQALNIIKKKQATIENNQETIQTLEDKVVKIEKKLQDAENAILARDAVIVKLRSCISSTDEDLAESGAVPSLDHTETKQTLKAAQSTVACLQARLAQKESSLSRYKDLLKKTQDETEAQKTHYQKELMTMWGKLQSQQDHAVSTVRQVASKIVNKPFNVIHNKQIVRLHQLEESVVDQEREILLLSQQLETSQNEIEKWKKEVEIVRRQRDIDQQNIEQELRMNIQTLEHEVNEKKQELNDHKERISVLEKELYLQKESFKQTTQQKNINVYDSLKHELVEKEKQLQALSKALTDLRSDMMITVQNNLASSKYDTIDQITMEKIIEDNTRDLQDKIKFYESQNGKLKRELKQQTEKISSMDKEIQGLKEDIARKHETTLKLRKENETMNKKINKLKINLQEKKTLQSESEDTANLQKKILRLEEQLKRQQQPEKPYDQLAKLTRSQEEIIRWEEGKKWQQTVERLKQRYQIKEEELEGIRKTEKLLRDQITRSDREKIMLESKIKNLYQKLSSENNEALLKSPIHQELLNKCHILEKEKTDIEENLKAENATIKTLQDENQKYLSKIDELEKEIFTLESNIQIQNQEKIDQAEYSARNEEIDEEILKLKEENLELKLQLQQMQIDIPYLNSKISELQKYCDALENEVEKKNSVETEDRKQHESNMNALQLNKNRVITIKKNLRNKWNKTKLSDELKTQQQNKVKVKSNSCQKYVRKTEKNLDSTYVIKYNTNNQIDEMDPCDADQKTHAVDEVCESESEQ